MTALVGFPLQTLYDITDISQAMPGVVTLSAVVGTNSFSVSEGMTVTISKVSGMYQINNKRFLVTNFDSDEKTFELYDLFNKPFDTTTFTPYIIGGEINIISYPGTPPGLMYNNQ